MYICVLGSTNQACPDDGLDLGKHEDNTGIRGMRVMTPLLQRAVHDSTAKHVSDSNFRSTSTFHQRMDFVYLTGSQHRLGRHVPISRVFGDQHRHLRARREDRVIPSEGRNVIHGGWQDQYRR